MYEYQKLLLATLITLTQPLSVSNSSAYAMTPVARITHVKGVIHYSFDSEFALIEAGNVIYQIRLEKLPAAEAKLLTQIGSQVSLELPPESIKNAWLVKPADAESQTASAQENQTQVQEQTIAQAPKGKSPVTIKGTILPSTVDSSGFVATDKFIYRVNMGLLTPSEKALIENHTNARIEIPTYAVDLTWNTQQSDLGSLARPQLRNQNQRDSVLEKSNSLWVRGTALQSFSNSDFWLQSGNYIFQLSKSNFDPIQSKILERHGARVAITVPNDSISYAWKIDLDAKPTDGGKEDSILH